MEKILAIINELKGIEKKVLTAKMHYSNATTHQDWSRVQEYLANARVALRILSVTAQETKEEEA